MALIDKFQHMLVEIIGTLMILVGGFGLISKGVEFISFVSKESSIITFLIILFVGLLLAGYRAVPQAVINLVRNVRGL